MLPRKNRIPTKDIPALARGRYESTGWFEYRKKISSLPHPRIAVIVGKKTLKSSPDRHSVKRRIYRHFQKSIASLPSVDIVVRAGVLWKERKPTKKEMNESAEKIFSNP
jgi:ribonuclease P protein component